MIILHSACIYSVRHAEGSMCYLLTYQTRFTQCTLLSIQPNVPITVIKPSCSPSVAINPISESSFIAVVTFAAGAQPKQGGGSVELRNVSFRYPARPEVQVFSEFSLKVDPGRSLALVGQSGSGKSTVISLIERFYDVEGGQVHTADVDTHIAQQALWSLVWQHAVCMHIDLFSCWEVLSSAGSCVGW